MPYLREGKSSCRRRFLRIYVVFVRAPVRENGLRERPLPAPGIHRTQVSLSSRYYLSVSLFMRHRPLALCIRDVSVSRRAVSVISVPENFYDFWELYFFVFRTSRTPFSIPTQADAVCIFFFFFSNPNSRALHLGICIPSPYMYA